MWPRYGKLMVWLSSHSLAQQIIFGWEDYLSSHQTMWKDITTHLQVVSIWQHIEWVNPYLFATNIRNLSAIRTEHLLVGFTFSSIHIQYQRCNSSTDRTLTWMNILPNLVMFGFRCSGNWCRHYFLCWGVRDWRPYFLASCRHCWQLVGFWGRGSRSSGRPDWQWLRTGGRGDFNHEGKVGKE